MSRIFSAYDLTSRTRAVLIAFLLATSIFPACASKPQPSAEASTPPSGPLFFEPLTKNRADADTKPYVVLVLIDGYRHDFNSVFSPPELMKMAKEGVSAESLRPVYPSKTFPNHYSIATGLYADKHGIVSNEFFDPARNEIYKISDRSKVEDGSWYFGEPLWIAIQKQGLLTGSVFWVGTESNIQQRHPNYYYRFDKTISNERRVDQVLEWLKLPTDRRPHFLTLYFDNVDYASHKNGVQSTQTREAVTNVDLALAQLRQGIADSKLPVNLIVVSDHGMVDLEADKVVAIDEDPLVAELIPKFKVVGKGPQMLLYLNAGENPKQIREMQKRLRSVARNYRVLRRDEMKSLHYSGSPRTGDLVIIPDMPYLVGIKSDLPSTVGANHGWVPTKDRTMDGIFIATGPAFKERTKIGTVENIHVYPLIMEILGLQIQTPVDGKLSAVKSVLKKK